jgi:hypothetical protein
MRRMILIAVTCAFLTTPVLADLYGGDVSVGGGGLSGFGAWDGASTKLAWSVTSSDDTPGAWTYSYTFSYVKAEASQQQGGTLSHIIFQVSDKSDALPAFNLASPLDFINTQNYDMGKLELQTWKYTKETYLPSGTSVYGIKFDSMFADSPSWTIQFDSFRNPMWGDFAAKDGTGTWAYNTSFGVDGLYTIAVPDTSYVPVPGALLLGSLGLGYAGMKLRRKCA